VYNRVLEKTRFEVANSGAAALYRKRSIANLTKNASTYADFRNCGCGNIELTLKDTYTLSCSHGFFLALSFFHKYFVLYIHKVYR
jgi:hypothetical protein